MNNSKVIHNNYDSYRYPLVKVTTKGQVGPSVCHNVFNSVFWRVNSVVPDQIKTQIERALK